MADLLTNEKMTSGHFAVVTSDKKIKMFGLVGLAKCNVSKS